MLESVEDSLLGAQRKAEMGKNLLRLGDIDHNQHKAIDILIDYQIYVSTGTS